MKRTLLTTILFFWISGVFAQVPEPKFYQDANIWMNSNDLTVSSVGHIVVVGDARNPGNNGFVTAISSDGYSIIWSKRFAGFESSFKNVLTSSDNTILLGGTHVDGVGGNSFPYLVKMTNAGDTLWTRSFFSNMTSASKPLAIKENFDGMYYGAWSHANAPHINLIRVDQQGLLYSSYMWSVDNYPSANVTALEIMSDSTVLIAAEVVGAGSDYGTVLMNVDTLGNVLWTKKYQDFLFERVLEIEGNIMIAGTWRESNLYTYNVTFELSPTGDFNWLNKWEMAAYSINNGRAGLTKESDSTALLLFPGGGFMGDPRAIYRVKSDGTIMDEGTFYLEATSLGLISSDSIVIVGNGPINGIKAGIYDPCYGLNWKDSLLQGSTFCFEYSGQIQSVTAPSPDTAGVTFVGIPIIGSVQTSIEELIPDVYIGCIPGQSSLDELTPELEMTVSTNSNGNWQVSFDSEEQITLEVQDLRGAVMKTQKLYKEVELDTGSLSSGVYIIRAQSDSGLYTKRKVAK